MALKSICNDWMEVVMGQIHPSKLVLKIQGQVTSGANSIAQRATITAVDADPSVLQHMVDAFHSRRDLVVGLLKKFRNKINVPEGAFMYSQTYLRSSENIKRNFNKRR
jgi:aspartate/methionine/tyrosine aminotransferase